MIHAMVVDDSALVREAFNEIAKRDKSIVMLEGASNPIFAMRKMQKHWPDVIILDIEMPEMDGLTFLKKIMAERPTPVVICSSLTANNASTSMAALASGAIDIISKPSMGLKNFFEEEAESVLATIKAASVAKMSRLGKTNKSLFSKQAKEPPFGKKLSADVIIPQNAKLPVSMTSNNVVAIGASTGGTQAIEQIVSQLDVNCTGLVVVIHMPAGFTNAFAKRLNSLYQVEVKEAADADQVIAGRVLIAPGDRHMLLNQDRQGYYVTIKDGPQVSRHRPSVDVLFRSVARNAKNRCLAALLTGMGDDGAKGLLEIKDAGSETVAQSKESCVVFGMPAEAIKLGAAMHVESLDLIASRIANYQQRSINKKIS